MNRARTAARCGQGTHERAAPLLFGNLLIPLGLPSGSSPSIPAMSVRIVVA
jgi:hypothetical protein